MFRYNMLGLAALALATGCASSPATTSTPASAIGGCSELDAEIVIAEEAKRSALDTQQGAWKAVIPFAVAARYAGGKSAAAAAEQRLEDLKKESMRRGCSAGSPS
jgi:hypothetical protein